jgi:hypothetical protein
MRQTLTLTLTLTQEGGATHRCMHPLSLYASGVTLRVLFPPAVGPFFSAATATALRSEHTGEKTVGPLVLTLSHFGSPLQLPKTAFVLVGGGGRRRRLVVFLVPSHVLRVVIVIVIRLVLRTGREGVDGGHKDKDNETNLCRVSKGSKKSKG